MNPANQKNSGDCDYNQILRDYGYTPVREGSFVFAARNGKKEKFLGVIGSDFSEGIEELINSFE